jgi:hypothetical protein
MRDSDLDRQARDRRGERIFVVSCLAAFLAIAACAVYFVARMLA